MTTIRPQSVGDHRRDPQTRISPREIPQDENSNIASGLEGGRELSKTILYVGNIHAAVTEEDLNSLFSSGTPLKSLKILHDKNNQGFNYAFVEYENNSLAKRALESLNGKTLGGYPLKISWAFQSQQIQQTSNTFNLFIGDLSLEINDEALARAFAKYPSLVQANVMWDMKTGRSRGYGFINFKDMNDASRALLEMNGALLGDRPVRLNWATHRQSGGGSRNHTHAHNRFPYNSCSGQTHGMLTTISMGPASGSTGYSGLTAPMAVALGPQVVSPQSYEVILRQTPKWHTVAYLGNLAHITSHSDLVPLLQNFGYIVNFKLMADKGCAFVTYDSHEHAALAIVQLNGFTLNGRPMRSGWGKTDKSPSPELHI